MRGSWVIFSLTSSLIKFTNNFQAYFQAENIARLWFVCLVCTYINVKPWQKHRLVGLVVKVSASRAEGPGFESCLRRDFFGVESYQ